MSPEQLWQATLSELELQLSKANFTTWFKNTAIISMENGIVAISVPNNFTKSWLEKKYHAPILSRLQQLTDRAVKKLSFHVGSATPINSTAPIAIPIASEPATSLRETGQTREALSRWGLNARYTFDSYIIGKGNELASAAARAVAARPGEAYNPLFIYGGVGLGKTHLLQAVGNEIVRQNPGAKILYVTSETFTSDFINAVRSGQAKNFQDRYRGVDLLMVDDVQFMSGKNETQEAFFHTFNALHQSNKQVLLSSDRPPKEINAMEKRLLSRFEWGMVADINPPDFETRVAILEKKCFERQYALDQDVVQYVAGVIQHNVRELEGALNKLIAFHQLKNTSLTLDFVKTVLTPAQGSAKRSVTPKHIIQTVATFFDVDLDEIAGKSREQRLAFPRQIIMYLLREELKYSFPAIGQELGGRDHTTAIHACAKIGKGLENDQKLKQDLEHIRQRLYITQ